MTKRIALVAAGLAAAATFVLPSSASANHPCWTGGIQNCLGERVNEILDSIEQGG